MGEIVRPHQPARIQHLGALERDPVVLEGRVNILPKILAWLLRELGHVEPVAMTIVGMVHPIHEMRDPSRVRLDANDLELRMALEHTTQDQHAHDVLVAAYDRHEGVGLWAACWGGDSFPRGQDMEAERKVD